MTVEISNGHPKRTVVQALRKGRKGKYLRQGGASRLMDVKMAAECVSESNDWLLSRISSVEHLRGCYGVCRMINKRRRDQSTESRLERRSSARRSSQNLKAVRNRLRRDCNERTCKGGCVVNQSLNCTTFSRPLQPLYQTFCLPQTPSSMPYTSIETSKESLRKPCGAHSPQVR